MMKQVLVGNRPAMSRRGGAKTGCLVALVVVLLLGAGLGYYVYSNWKSWAATTMKAATAQLVQQAPIPADERDRIVSRVDGLGTEFKDGKITLDQLGKVLEAIAQSPIFPSGMVIAAERKYLNPSGLPNEEKEAGRRTLQRLARGVVEKKVTMQEAETAAAPISTKDQQGSLTLKDMVTDAELREFLTNAKAKADAAQIPDEAYIINFADELDKVIAQALNRPLPAGTSVPAPTAPTPSAPAPTAPSDPATTTPASTPAPSNPPS